MQFVATKTADQLDLQALHGVRERLVGQRTGVINQIRAFLLERGIAVRQGLRSLRSELPGILATRTDVLAPRMLRIIEDLAGDWRRLDARIEDLSSEIEALARQDNGCERLLTVPGMGPIISSAMVAAIGTGDGFSKGRDFGAWLGLVFCWRVNRVGLRGLRESQGCQPPPSDRLRAARPSSVISYENRSSKPRTVTYPVSINSSMWSSTIFAGTSRAGFSVSPRRIKICLSVNSKIASSDVSQCRSHVARNYRKTL